MASDVDICNLALSHFGQDGSIDSIDPPDESVEAEKCATFYPIARDLMLGRYDWSFARKYGTPNLQTNDTDQFAYKYRLPVDCIKPRRVLPGGYSDEFAEAVPYKIVGRDFYTDAEDAVLVYTYKLTDTGVLSAQCVMGLSFLLASMVSGPITKDSSGRTQGSLRQAAHSAFSEAEVEDANADKHEPRHRSTAEVARGASARSMPDAEIDRGG